jgi:hypothetical protein
LKKNIDSNAHSNTKIIQIRTNVNYTNTSTIYNVIGVFPGVKEPDRYVIVGGHHDAWVGSLEFSLLKLK